MQHFTRKIREYLQRGIVFWIVLAALVSGLAGAEEELTSEKVTEKLYILCTENQLEDGAFWQGAEVFGQDQKASAAFAVFLGKLLFGPGDPEKEWERLITIPQVKAKGLRAGDILCSEEHWAMILSVTPLGEIRTIECTDEENPVIRINGFFRGKAENATLEGFAEKESFEAVLRSPENTSPPVWSARLAALPEEPSIIGATYPTYLSNDQHFGLRGTVMCKYPMKKIRATVTNRITGELLFDVSVYPDAEIYRIGNPTSETINDQLVFDSPECANSYLNYSLEVTIQKEDQILKTTVLSQNFKVGTPAEEEPQE